MTNYSYPKFSSWSSAGDSASGDFNGDGVDDIALSGPFQTIPVAYGQTGGTFHVTNNPYPTFPGWGSNPSSRLISGDFNGDGYDDLAMTNGEGWDSVPVAFANPDGGFGPMTNDTIKHFGSWAQAPGAKAIVGNFDGEDEHGNRTSDIALVGSRSASADQQDLGGWMSQN